MKEVVRSLSDGLQNSIDELKGFDWSDIGDVESAGVWPGAVKFLISILLFSACLGAGYWFWVKDLQEQLSVVAQQEQALRSELETKAVIASNLDAYRAQMREMDDEFAELLGQLPGATEVPGLLDDITYTGLGSGLEFSIFQPLAESTEEFYIELPISISVTGSYHDFGTFVSGVASLDRIVTLHDFEIIEGNERGSLDMTIMARTYRYNAGEGQ